MNEKAYGLGVFARLFGNVGRWCMLNEQSFELLAFASRCMQGKRSIVCECLCLEHCFGVYKKGSLVILHLA